MAEEKRYQVQRGPRSGHDCCFRATVVDTAASSLEENGDVVCECASRELAERVAAALNAAGAN